MPVGLGAGSPSERAAAPRIRSAVRIMGIQAQQVCLPSQRKLASSECCSDVNNSGDFWLEFERKCLLLSDHMETYRESCGFYNHLNQKGLAWPMFHFCAQYPSKSGLIHIHIVKVPVIKDTAGAGTRN